MMAIQYKSLLVVLLMSISCSVFSGAAQIEVHQSMLNEYKPEKVADHTYVIHGPDRSRLMENQGFVNNPAFIISEKSVIIVDPGTSVQIGRALLKHIRTITNKPVTHVFNTHVHGDHWLANQAFTEENSEVKIYAHPTMIEEMKSSEAERWLEVFTELTNGAIKGTEIVVPMEALEDQQIVKIDNIRVKAHLSEWAHTKTDVMLEVLEDRLLFTGDTVNNQRIVPFNEGSFKGSIDAISKAIQLDPEVVVPGHGPTDGISMLTNYKAGLESIYQSAKVLAEDDLEPFEMKEKVLSSHKEFKGWMGFEDEVGRYLSIAVLEAEQEDF